MGFNKKDQSIILKCIQDLDISYDIGWKNFSRNLNLPQALVLNIEKVDTLPIVIKQINKINENKKSHEKIIVRVAAGGKSNFLNSKGYSESYSFTPGAEADIIIRLTGDYFYRVKVKDSKLNTAEIGPSIQMGELDQILYDKYQLILPTSSLIPYVTFGGISANAGHGTGRDQPSVCGLITAITLCGPDGNIIRIDKKHPDFNTIRGAHLGAFGIVIGFEISCQPAKKLACTIEAKNFNELIKDIQSGLFIKNPYVSVMYVPTYATDEKKLTTNKNILIIKWQPVSLEEKSTFKNPLVRHMGEEFGIRFAEKFSAQELLVSYPNLIPYYMKYIVSKATVGDKKENFIGPWPQIVHYQTAYPRDIDDADFLFNVSEDGNEILTALHYVMTTLNHFAEKQAYPITNAIYLRFFSGTKGGLSTSDSTLNKRVCAFDLVSHPNIPGYQYFKTVISNFFINKLQAKPHWGKTLPPGINYEKIYGAAYIEFKAALERWYKSCKIPLEKSLFLNRFLCQILGLPLIPESRLTLTNERKITPAIFTPLQLNLIASKLVNFIKTEEDYKNNPHALSLILETKRLTEPQLSPYTKKSIITASPRLFQCSTNNVKEQIPQKSIKISPN